MQIYLPIAEIPVNIFLILALGLLTGFLAGMFGIGGGFLATPFLIFIGVPSPVAVSTSTNQIIAASISGLLAHFKKGNVDIKMGLFLVLGGLIGSSFGVSIFSLLKNAGQIDLVIAITYVLFLGSISLMMLSDGFKNFIDKKVENAPSHLLRSGITYFYKSFSIGAQYSYVSEVYSDANNTLIPTANGQNGLIPSYQIVDMHATYSYKNIYHIKLGLNNLTNEKYFTRRSGGYPGPGLLPAEGRSFFATLGIKF
jgi:hypothetical protein